ncbi:MAG: ATP-binding protein, partial [Clostridia bacterium]|nr:ATP-binding protein [Clostridia bacterium]
MGIINILDAQTANLIAAGEVVERPSSATKELLENSIDAHAENITLEIKSGGRVLIRVTDDGHGFLREDIPKALLRHATSKIECGDDINGIRSLGFRGEALAAIGSVSRLEIVTKHRNESIGTRLTADENGIIMEDVGCPDGTTVSMRDIFYNTPARQKFLKKDGTEAASCVAAAERLALSHPEISFTVICDGERKFMTSGDGDLYPAVYSVFGREFAKSLISVEYELGGVAVKGFVSSPDAVRGSRAMQTMFVNGRYVKSKTVQAAIEEA